MGENDEKEQAQPQTSQLIANPIDIVPKYCTLINFSVTTNNQVIMTLSYADDPGQSPVLIDRVMIDVEHAKNLSKVINELVEKIEHDGTK